MEFNFSEIEEEIKKFWAEKQLYKVKIDSSKPKYYVLDMFPYPSGAGLHVGHPLGYIGSDIIARYKRMKGFNVLHPMGYDSFGLPAEQYAIQTGQHPAVTTEQNIKRYREQLDKIGFSFDWSRQVKTSDPSYYKWTQWIFIQLFKSWYNKKTDKAEHIDSLVKHFETKGSEGVEAKSTEHTAFTAAEWKGWNEKQQQEMLLNYRLAFLADSWVNWCPALGTVLANDEVKDGVSERGGYPVEQRLMQQWSLRITAYSERLLKGLDTIDWPESLKEAQRNWIGKSEGARVQFMVDSPLQRRGVGGEVLKSEEEKNPPYYTANADNAGFLVEQAKANRKNPTEAEELLWEYVRNSNLGVKFRRQHYIGNYITDFVCLSKKLIIELDGEHHKTAKEYDEDRTRFLNVEGYTVLRFWNDNVLKKTGDVIKEIKETLSKLPDYKDLTPDPSPKERGADAGELCIEVFTTRPDTIFGVTFMVLAPEHELVEQITTPEQKEKIEAYKKKAAARSERERNADVKNVSGEFTGAYAVHPFTGKNIPIYIADYVLATYGTGAVMAVPAGDSRDYRFAKHFNLPIENIFSPDKVNLADISEEAYEGKDGNIVNSGFLTGLDVPQATTKAVQEIEKKGIGQGKINYRQRDAIFGRQRYWGEPIPIYYKDKIPFPMEEKDLPLVLPEIDKYLPTETGEPPLARAKDWTYSPSQGRGAGGEVYPLETTTMPGWAGSSWYFLRYMDPHNDKVFAGKEALDYWKEIDFYLGGSEHSTGHLLYFRFWTKFLYDLGHLSIDEPAQKMVNQGMIQGLSAFVYVLKPLFTWGDNTEEDENKILPLILISKSLAEKVNKNILEVDTVEKIRKIALSSFKKLNPTIEEVWFNDHLSVYLKYVNINYAEENVIKVDILKKSLKEYYDAEFINEENGVFLCERTPEKMSKSKLNVVTPDDNYEDGKLIQKGVIDSYGADCFRMYEMFLGPIELSKPWDTQGIDGTSRFLRKLWRMFYNGEPAKWIVTEEAPTKDELKVLHKTIKKINENIEELSFNTSVSAFMVCVNELSALMCNKKAILEPLIAMIHPFAPFTTEYLWKQLGHTGSILNSSFPQADETLLVESSFEYPVSVNGKLRTKINLPLELQQGEVEKEVLALDIIQKWMEGKPAKKIIYVKGRMINVVV